MILALIDHFQTILFPINNAVLFQVNIFNLDDLFRFNMWYVI